MSITITSDESSREIDIYSKEGFDLLTTLWIKSSCHHKIMYEPTWLGIPIIQYAEDIVMMQELIWKVRPDVIVETGIAHGGSAVLYASILELLGKGRVIGIDVEIRKYNRVAIQSHPLSKRITLVESSSIDPGTVQNVSKSIQKEDTVLVVLDSNHSYDHVLQEMELYADLVAPNSYMVVMDAAQGLAWDIPNGNLLWKDDNPLRAIEEFLAKHPEWKADPHYVRMGITSNQSGFLRRWS